MSTESEYWRPFDKDFISNPYPSYKALRDLSPVYQTKQGDWVVTRYKDVKYLYKHPACRVGNRVDGLKKLEQDGKVATSFASLIEAIQTFLVFVNPPDHTVMKKFIANSWSNKSIEDLINKNINYLNERCDWGNCDFVKEIAEPLPVLTMAGILGIPISDYPVLIDKMHDVFRSFDLYLTIRDLRKIQKSIEALRDYFLQQIEIKKREPDNSLISNLVERNTNYNNLELSHICLFLFIAGGETTGGLISLGMNQLIPHWNSILKNSSFSMGTVEELLRLESPIQVVVRTLSEDLTVEKVKIPTGGKVALVIGSANRDEQFFDNPDQIQPDRQVRHLAFGAGIHHCMGDWAAKAEAYLLYKFMLGRFKKINLLDPPEVKYNLTFRSLESLRINATT